MLIHIEVIVEWRKLTVRIVQVRFNVVRRGIGSGRRPGFHIPQTQVLKRGKAITMPTVIRTAAFKVVLKGSLSGKDADIFIRPPKKQSLRFMERDLHFYNRVDLVLFMIFYCQHFFMFINDLD